MQTRELFHGTNGDNILSILNSHQIRPNDSGTIFFSDRHPESVFMHGGDRRRRAAFAIKVEVTIPTDAPRVQRATHGVVDTVVITTTQPLSVRVLELHVRTLEGGCGTVRRLFGESDIRDFLRSEPEA